MNSNKYLFEWERCMMADVSQVIKSSVLFPQKYFITSLLLWNRQYLFGRCWFADPVLCKLFIFLLRWQRAPFSWHVWYVLALMRDRWRSKWHLTRWQWDLIYFDLTSTQNCLTRHWRQFYSFKGFSFNELLVAVSLNWLTYIFTRRFIFFFVF